MQIRAAVARAKSAPMSLEDLSLEEPRDDEILVRLAATGICHTDIVMRDQFYPVPQPIVLGHEGAGIVEKVGRSVTKVAAGDHVVMSFNSCGACPSCLHDAASYCHEFFERNFAGQRSDGSSPLRKGREHIHGYFFGQSSFASHAICNQRNVVKVRKDVPLDLLGPLACGVQTGAGTVINGLKIGPGHALAVFGTGSVGLSAIMAAKAVGATTIIGVDLSKERLKLAKALGATHTVDGGAKDVAARIAKITGAGVDFSIDATGVPAAIRTAVDCLAPRGTCALVGASKLGAEVALDLTFMLAGGRTFKGVVEGEATPELFIPTLIELYLQGRFPFDRLISFYPFERINEAIHDSETGAVVKAVIRMPGTGSGRRKAKA